MSDFKTRLIDEHRELNERREKLVEFQNSEKFAGIPVNQQRLLNIQASAMLTYSQCLVERIAEMGA